MTNIHNAYYLEENQFQTFVEKMLVSKKLIGPKVKHKQFVFDEIKDASELRLDYDVTVLPPKKEFFPPKQELLTFNEKGYLESIHVVEKILFGVHFYDIKAIDQTDLVFFKDNPDKNYLAHRQATTLVGSNVQKISPRAFWSTVGSDVEPKGHDAFITKLKKGFLFETFSQKGEALIGMGKFQKANAAQIREGKEVNENVLNQCPENLPWSTKEIADTVRKSFRNEALWTELAQKCFSCGSCNTVCPTCYCFDVQDHWNLDQKSGARTRYWDSCLTEDFATISLGGGNHENFRESRAQRKRHRFMRKTTYLNTVLGGPACVGCGRCSMACTADIADPVKVITRIMKEYGKA